MHEEEAQLTRMRRQREETFLLTKRGEENRMKRNKKLVSFSGEFTMAAFVKYLIALSFGAVV
jgi:hypothetical protein